VNGLQHTRIHVRASRGNLAFDIWIWNVTPQHKLTKAQRKEVVPRGLASRFDDTAVSWSIVARVLYCHGEWQFSATSVKEIYAKIKADT
jgi:hypothetical protein